LGLQRLGRWGETWEFLAVKGDTIPTKTDGDGQPILRLERALNSRLLRLCSKHVARWCQALPHWAWALFSSRIGGLQARWARLHFIVVK
jgi:hypothetical protein